MTRLLGPPESLAELFLDEVAAADDAAVDDVIRRAGGERQAVRALLTQLGETEHARALAEASASLGYRRGRQPGRPG
ncbi:hypothetical protein ACFSCV_07775 [Methylopila henanensis]|uniref:Uncharacterized protein n=1 Tax=Methylopila henanensis TaxID=873516 RepID=A0ABW4K451_9HYPH